MKRKSKALEKELADHSKLLRAWTRWHREQREEALAGPHGTLVARLLEILRGLTLRDGAKLVGLIRAQNWDRVDFDTRFICLHEINERITILREQAGLAPFDDAMPPERTTGFLIIRQAMFGN
jgi:hypothetical protein